MSTNARWIIGLLIALVIGLGIALASPPADDDSDEGTTVTVPHRAEPRHSRPRP